MDHPYKILITAFGSSNARAIATILEERFPILKVMATDSNPPDTLTPHSFVSKIIQVPVSTHENYIGAIKEICVEEEVNVIIPVYDDEVIEISKRRKVFDDLGIKLLLSSLSTLQTCRDKYSFYQFGKLHKIPVIESSLAPDFDYPQFLKPRKGNGSKDCFIINNQEEADVLSKRVDLHMFQELKSGRVMDVDFVANEESELLTHVIKEELQTKNGIGVKVKICENNPLTNLLQHLIKSLNYIGIGAVEFFVNGEDISVIEVNIRPSSGIIFSHKAGGDFLGHFFNAIGYSDARPLDKEINFGQRMNRELIAFQLEKP